MTETNVKISSILLLSILLLGPTLLIFLSTPATAASGPTLTFSATTGVGSGQSFGFEVTGAGFPALAQGTGVTLYWKSTTLSVSTAGATNANIYGQSLRLGVVTTGDAAYPKNSIVDCAGNAGVTAAFPDAGATTSCPPAGTSSVDSNGGFTAYFDTADLPGGTYNLFAAYTPSGGSQQLTSATVFTLTSKVNVELAADNGVDHDPTTHSGHFGQEVQITVYGFGNAEAVSVVGVSSNNIPAINTGADGKSAAVYAALNVDTTGGSKTVTAFGQTTGDTASTTFTIKPSIAVFTSQTSGTSFSIPAAAPSSVYLELHGFANAETITTIKVGGQTASSLAATTTAAGAYGGVNNRLSALYTASLPFGQTSIVVTGSTTGAVTFNSTNGNVINPYGALSGAGFPLLNVPIVASTDQNLATETAIQQLSETTGNVGDTPLVIYAGLHVGDDPCGHLTFNAVADASTKAAVADAQGVELCKMGAIPATAKGTYTITATAGLANVKLAAVSFSIVPDLIFSSYSAADGGGGINQFTNSNAANQAGYFAVNGDGFTANQALSLTIGSDVIAAAFATVPDANGHLAQTAIAAPGFPDLPEGTYSVVMTGSTSGNTATGIDSTYSGLGITVNTVQVITNFQMTNNFNNAAIEPNAVVAGQTVVLLSSTTLGIHGLSASTAYSLYLDGPSGTKLGTFTSTASGQVAAGTQFVVPAAVSGAHVVDIVSSGASVLNGFTYNGPNWTGNEGDESTFGQLFILVSGSVSVTPSAGPVGSTVVLTGSGLPASTSFVVQIHGTGITYTTFTSDSTGAIPAGVSFVWPNSPANAGAESGTSFTIDIDLASNLGTVATGSFLQQAAFNLNATSGSAGAALSGKASGLQANTAYDVVWGASITANGITTGTVISAFTAKADGSGSVVITVPSSAVAGQSYTIQLVTTANGIGKAPNTFILVNAPSVSAGTQQNGSLGTSTLTPGSPTQATFNTYQDVQLAFTNTYKGTLTATGFAVVTNALGQVVYYTTATATLTAGQQQTLYFVLAGLPSGTYTVNIYAISSNGVVVSQTVHATAVI